jgi:hypothetical protein
MENPNRDLIIQHGKFIMEISKKIYEKIEKRFEIVDEKYLSTK